MEVDVLHIGLLFALWSQPSLAFDQSYAAFDAFLQGAVTDEGVRYDLLAKRRELLDTHLEAVATVDASGFDKAQRIALMVNAYNGYTLATMLDAMPVDSIRDLDGGKVWSTRRFQVAGRPMTLDAMEHEHARKLADGRVHAVINCASKGCPPLPPTPLLAEGLDASLDAYARRWVQTNAVDVAPGKVSLSKIFDWYAEDFVSWRPAEVTGESAKMRGAWGFVSAFGGPPLPEGEVVWSWAEYDWSLNAIQATD